MSTESIILLVAFIIGHVVVGLVLSRQISAQQQMMAGWKDLLATMDPAKIKEANDLIAQGIEMKHKLWATNAVNEVTEQMGKELISMNASVKDRYNELVAFALAVLSSQSPEHRESLLADLPNTHRMLREHLRNSPSTTG